MGLAMPWLSITNYLYWARISCLPDSYSQSPTGVLHQFHPFLDHCCWLTTEMLPPCTERSQTHFDWMVSVSSPYLKAAQHQIPSKVLRVLPSWALEGSICPTAVTHILIPTLPLHTWNLSSLQAEYEPLTTTLWAQWSSQLLTHIVVCPSRPQCPK